MTFEDLKKIQNAPDSGYIYVCFRKGVEFGAFKRDKNDIQAEYLEKYKNDKVLELHLFDIEKEYRVVYKQDGTIIETIITEENMKEKGYDTYIESPLFYGEKVCNQEEKGMVHKVELMDKHVKKVFHFPIKMEQLKEAYRNKKGLHLKIVNYFQYDDNDMIRFMNYRLVGLYLDGKVIESGV